MPSQQPKAAIHALERQLLEEYARAWERVEALHESIKADPARWRQRERLERARREIWREMDRLDARAQAWFSRDFPKVHAWGVNAGAKELGLGAREVWGLINPEAVSQLAADGFDDLLQATKGVRQSSKALIRQVVRDAALQRAIAGQDTAVSAARRAEQLIRSHGIHSVRYKDGSTHGLREYSRMAVRTKTAQAYNLGTIEAGSAVGVTKWEVFDGICGWTFHDDTAANGMIVTADQAMAYPISHPNCRRAFGARPDLQGQAPKVERGAPELSPAKDEDPLAKIQREMREQMARNNPEAARRAAELAPARVDARPQRAPAKKPGGWPPPPRAKRPARSAKGAKYPPRGDADDAVRGSRFEDDLHRLDGDLDPEDAIKGVNPDYQTSSDYRNNCTNAVTAYELRRRGYDVSARGMFGASGRNAGDFFEDWGLDARSVADGAFSTGDEIRAALLDEWPDGARGFVTVVFETGLRRGGHVFSVEKHGGRLFFVDPQTGAALGNAEQYFSQAGYRSIMYGRLDNQVATDRLRGHLR